MNDELKSLEARAEADPMPPGLENSLRDLIEPFTMHVEMEHGDAMGLLRIVYPSIKDWLFNQTVNWRPQIESREDYS